MTADCQPGIRRGQSCAIDARQAVREFHAAVVQPDAALVIFFCSSKYDLAVLAAEIRLLFSGVSVVGCTTAGEIGPAGCIEHSLTGASFPAGTVSAVAGGIEHLRQFEFGMAKAFTQDLLQRLESQESRASDANSFALLLIDGLSMREELVARSLQSALSQIPLIGGSAGDGLSFGTTRVFHDGVFHSDGAVVVLVSTQLPFRVFKTQHFIPTEQRIVVTDADAGHRVVREIDGWPAATFYARLVGSEVRNLDPLRFATSPVMVLIDGTNYVRSIQKASPDGSLTFFCAIEEGLVLRLAHGVDLVGNLERVFAGIQADIGRPQLVLGCDCILRKLEIVQCGLVDRVDAVMRDNNVIGFNSYGEQYRGVHVNQTLTGIAIGEMACG